MGLMPLLRRYLLPLLQARAGLYAGSASAHRRPCKRPLVR